MHQHFIFLVSNRGLYRHVACMGFMGRRLESTHHSLHSYFDWCWYAQSYNCSNLLTYYNYTPAVTGSILVHTYATSGFSKNLYDDNVTLWVVIFGSVTFTANFYAICIMGYKAW